MKAIIFAKVKNTENKEELLNIQLDKLRTYASKNFYEVIDEYKAFEDSNLGESKTFLKILNKIEKQQYKIYIICYSEFTSSKTDIDDKFRALLKQEKVEIENYSHPCFKEPDDIYIKTWRYLTLPKFIELLQTKTLFFTRADLLREGDNSESSYFTDASENIVNEINKLSKQNINIPHPTIPELSVNDVIKGQLASNSYNENYLIKQNFINCWHMNEFENFAMWKIYSEKFGVCIQSTYKNLYSCFTDKEWGFYNKRHKIYIGEVKYIDWKVDTIPQDNMFWPYLHKKKEFMYEQELRCLINCQSKSQLKVKIDTNKLISSIYINPFTPSWFKEVVRDLCEKYGTSSKKVIQSSLSAKI